MTELQARCVSEKRYLADVSQAGVPGGGTSVGDRFGKEGRSARGREANIQCRVLETLRGSRGSAWGRALHLGEEGVHLVDDVDGRHGLRADHAEVDEVRAWPHPLAC